MPIVTADILHQLSGGAGNTDPNAALGGAISSTAIVDNTTNNLFDSVSAAEALAGDTEYRGFYGKNNHGSITLAEARVFISQATSSADDEFDIGVAVEAMNVTMATIANESTAPTSVTFSRPTTYGTGLALNSTTGLTAGSSRGIWVRRTVNAAAAAATGVTGIIKIEGTTT